MSKFKNILLKYWMEIVIAVFTVGGTVAAMKIYREWDVARIDYVETELQDHIKKDDNRIAEFSECKTKVLDLQINSKQNSQLNLENARQLSALNQKVEGIDKKIDEMNGMLKQHLFKSASIPLNENNLAFKEGSD